MRNLVPRHPSEPLLLLLQRFRGVTWDKSRLWRRSGAVVSERGERAKKCHDEDSSWMPSNQKTVLSYSPGPPPAVPDPTSQSGVRANTVLRCRGAPGVHLTTPYTAVHCAQVPWPCLPKTPDPGPPSPVPVPGPCPCPPSPPTPTPVPRCRHGIWAFTGAETGRAGRRFADPYKIIYIPVLQI